MNKGIKIFIYVVTALSLLSAFVIQIQEGDAKWGKNALVVCGVIYLLGCIAIYFSLKQEKSIIVNKHVALQAVACGVFAIGFVLLANQGFSVLPNVRCIIGLAIVFAISYWRYREITTSYEVSIVMGPYVIFAMLIPAINAFIMTFLIIGGLLGFVKFFHLEDMEDDISFGNSGGSEDKFY